jgi:putative membrane protein
MRQVNVLWIVVAAVAGVALVSLATAGGMIGGAMGPGMMGEAYRHALPPGADGGAWPGMMGLGWLMMLVFWTALGVGVYLLVKSVSGQSSRGEDVPDALEILRRRYAAGEIDEATYERQRVKLAA